MRNYLIGGAVAVATFLFLWLRESDMATSAVTAVTCGVLVLVASRAVGASK